jgi:hypothetical protein
MDQFMDELSVVAISTVVPGHNPEKVEAALSQGFSVQSK